MPRCLLAFEPPDGGVAENVMRLALGLGAHGWDVSVAGPRDAIVYPSLRDAGIPVARLALRRGYGHPRDDLSALRGLGAILRRGSLDLIHAHSAKAGVLGRAAAVATGTPAVYSPHCFPFVGPWRPPRRLFSVAAERALGPRTAAIVCVAEAERRLALRHRLAPESRLHLVPNGSPACTETLEPDPELARFADGGPLAACVTVLRPQKAVHVFVDAAPKVLAAVPDSRLAVVGDGELRGELEQRAAAHGLDASRFQFFSFAPPAARQLRSLDVFVLPSAWEALPIAVLEAMACGVPQVVTDVGGTAEATVDGATGLVCPPNDPEALADRIITLLRDPARRERMSSASRERHAEQFGIERMVAATAHVYDVVASAG
jgi:glycosyltransferase involved in cell wall biosynthesis